MCCVFWPSNVPTARQSIDKIFLICLAMKEIPYLVPMWTRKRKEMDKRLAGAVTSAFVSVILALFVGLERLAAVEAIAPSDQQKPNVVVILADDLGFNDVSFHGSPQIPTPNIDALARDGITLNNYYVNPICTPTRSSLMTGKYPIHTGLWRGVITAAGPWGLSLNETILPQYLKKQGYATHMVGKWHLGFFRKEYTPTYRGFDSHFGYWCGKEDYYDHTNEERKYWGLDFRRNMSLADDYYDEYSTELYTNEASKVILRHDRSKPLFLYVAHQAVHSANSYSPLQAPQKYVDRMKHIHDPNRRLFAAMVSALDDSVGGIVQTLTAQNMMNNTIIIFSTDNGGPAAGFDLNYASNWPLRGIKHLLWEGGVRGTGFVWSSKFPKPVRASISKQLMHVTDWLPTIYNAAGGDLNDLGEIDGVNMWPALVNNLTSPRNHILHNIDRDENYAALRKGDYKLIIGQGGDTYNGWYPPEGFQLDSKANAKKFPSKVGKILVGNSNFMPSDMAVQCGPKPANASTNCQPKTKPCLYNVIKDPCEYLNVAEDFPEVLQDLLNMMHAFNETVVPARNTKDDPNADPRLHDFAWVPWKDSDKSKKNSLQT